MRGRSLFQGEIVHFHRDHAHPCLLSVPYPLAHKKFVYDLRINKEQGTLVRKSLNNTKLQSIKVADIDIALHMLRLYLNAQDINGLLASLEALKTDPQNQAYQEQVIEAFNDLGPLQGAALTYAPYLNVFVSDDPFGD